MLAERLGRLPDRLQEALRAASVEGETFTCEVAARVRKIEEEEMLDCFSDELDRRHHLVSAQGVRRLGAQRVSQYRFRHILFQQ